jgi:hypothetical protein
MAGEAGRGEQMLTAWTKRNGHTYLVRYTRNMYPLALTEVLRWNQAGIVSNRVAVELYGAMRRLQVQGDSVCKGK